MRSEVKWPCLPQTEEPRASWEGGGPTDEQDDLTGASWTWLALRAPVAKCWWHQAASSGICDPVLFLPRFYFFLSLPFSYFLPYFIIFPILPLSSHVTFSLLSAPSGGSDRNWWGYRGGGSDAKESACNAGGLGLMPGSGRSPGEGNGNPFQYSCLENSMGRGAWRDTVHGVTRVRHKWATDTNTGWIGRLSGCCLAGGMFWLNCIRRSLDTACCSVHATVPPTQTVTYLQLHSFNLPA